MKLKKMVIVLFLTVLYLPFVLGLVSKAGAWACDVPLKGFTDSTEKPAFSAGSFLKGEFQKNFTKWYEASFKPRGVITKTYATIRYHCFNLGNRFIGYNKDIYDMGYINAEWCINGAADYSEEEHQKNMQNYVEKLKILQDKLARFGKYLYVYIAPSKANFYPENIPQKYKAIADKNAVPSTVYFSQLIAETDIPHLICRDQKDTLQYPAFYTTGVHWSRTFEQETSARIIRELSEITGKNYRNIMLEEVKQSSIPFWRDSDVYDLLNIWGELQGDFYEYMVNREYAEDYDKIRVLVHGDSFGMGIRKDILDLYPYEAFWYINRAQYIQYNYDTSAKIDSWDTFDITNCLNDIDVVVLETTESEVVQYAYGFVDYLIEFLDTYDPQKSSRNYVENLNCDSKEAWESNPFNGVWTKGEKHTFVWAKDYTELLLKDEEIAAAGLELQIGISPHLFEGDETPDIVEVFVNGKKLLHKEFQEAWSGSLFISAEELAKIGAEDLYDVEIYCSKSFIPKEKGINDDSRDLAIQLMYAGRAR